MELIDTPNPNAKKILFDEQTEDILNIFDKL